MQAGIFKEYLRIVSKMFNSLTLFILKLFKETWNYFGIFDYLVLLLFQFAVYMWLGVEGICTHTQWVWDRPLSLTWINFNPNMDK